ncbi:hypothetical protein VO54_01618 [Elizabethkingia miricola]|nr:hypothetical protein VO54_01618 [Elizabethkingia miricola]
MCLIGLGIIFNTKARIALQYLTLYNLAKADENL